MSQMPVQEVIIHKVQHQRMTETGDKLAVEEPLEISLTYRNEGKIIQKKVSVTMRTPGNDKELAAGFLFTEGVISSSESISQITEADNRVVVVLREGISPNLGNSDRNFYTTSSCGVCGKASLEAIHTVSVYPPSKDDRRFHSSILLQLQEKIRTSQRVFEDTGGIHASAFFSYDGELQLLKEDVGRHNALDKLIGAAMLDNKLPLDQGILFLSGRSSFELVQKAAMAGIRVIAAVGAPSSLAVSLAREQNITLLGFLRGERFNVYSGGHRIML